MKINKLDQYYPLICGSILAFSYLCIFSLYPRFSLTDRFRELFIAAITINAIAVGFLATAKATLLSIHDSKVIIWMKDSGVYEITIKHFMDAVKLSMLCSVLSMLLLLIDFKNPVKYVLWGIAVWIFLVTYAMLALYRIINIFSKILQKS